MKDLRAVLSIVIATGHIKHYVASPSWHVLEEHNTHGFKDLEHTKNVKYLNDILYWLHVEIIMFWI